MNHCKQLKNDISDVSESKSPPHSIKTKKSAVYLPSALQQRQLERSTFGNGKTYFYS